MADSRPRFMRVLQQIATGAPITYMADEANTRLEAIYNSGLEIIAKAYQGSLPSQGHLDAAENIIEFTQNIELILRMTRSVGIPFFDEDWCLQYWVPITNLCMSNDGVEASMKISLKIDWDHLSSECKVDVLSMLGRLLGAGFLSPDNADEVINLIYMTFFGENSSMAETRSTRKATVKLALQSKLPEGLLKYFAAAPVTSRNRAQKLVDCVKRDSAFFLGLIFSVLLGEMRTDLATKHSPRILEAIKEASPGIWDELKRVGDGITPQAKVDSGSARLFHLAILGISLGVLCSADRVATGVASHEALVVDTMRHFTVYTGGFSAVEQSNFLAISKEVYRSNLPPIKETVRWFASVAEQFGENAHPLALQSNNRRAEATMGPMPKMSKEQAMVYSQQVYNDQMNRGLLNSDHKPVVQDLTAGKVGNAGRECAECGLEGKTNTNLKLMRCSACTEVYYCSVFCQKAHWKVHKPQCKAAQAARAAAGGGSG